MSIPRSLKLYNRRLPWAILNEMHAVIKKLKASGIRQMSIKYLMYSFLSAEEKIFAKAIVNNVSKILEVPMLVKLLRPQTCNIVKPHFSKDKFRNGRRIIEPHALAELIGQSYKLILVTANIFIRIIVTKPCLIC